MNHDRDTQKTMPVDPQLSALYRRTRNGTSSPALDDSIRYAARRVARRRRYRWLLPLSSAAVVLLGLSLSFKVVELDRPLEEASPSELDDADEKSESASPPDRAEPAVPAPSLAPYALKELSVDDEQNAAPVRKRSMAPVQDEQREERPALNLDQAATMGLAAPSPSPAGGQRAGIPEAKFLDELKNDPPVWLRHIRDLVSQGRTADAAVQLAEFRASHPNYPLPDDLAELLDR